MKHLRHCLGAGDPDKQQTLLCGVRTISAPSQEKPRNANSPCHLQGDFPSPLFLPSSDFPLPVLVLARLCSDRGTGLRSELEEPSLRSSFTPGGSAVAWAICFSPFSVVFLVVINTKSPGRGLEQERRKVVNLTRRGNQLTYVKMGTGKGTFYLVLER